MKRMSFFYPSAYRMMERCASKKDLSLEFVATMLFRRNRFEILEGVRGDMITTRRRREI